MLRLLAALLLSATLAAGAHFRLYLADGSYHIVREYHVEGDRVRYYSVERSEWEEIPLRLVDLERTEAERAQREQALRKQTEALAEEERIEHEQRRIVERIPQQPGVYRLTADLVQALPQAECKVATNKGRSVLKVLTPLPIVAGKANVELDGEQSKTLISEDRPEFFIRLSAPERFGIVRLWTQKRTRIVQKWNIIPITNEVIEEQQDVEVFRQQLDEDLYKIWPVEPLKPGEYAVIQYTQGKRNVQVWDFSYRP
ncbi:MAG: hypothetical protein ACPL88_09515 [Bryobacteraceae bacterium]